MRAAIVASSVLVGSLSAAVARADPPPPAAPAPLDARLPPRVTSAFARAAIAAALRAAGFPRKLGELAGMAARVRPSAALPELVLRATRSTDQSLRFAPTADDPAHYSEAGGAGLWLEARLVWHLDRLLFDRDELAVEHLLRDREGDAAKVSARVIELLFAWERAARTAEDADAEPDARALAVLKQAESEVLLDVLTAGWFGRMRPAAIPAR